MYSSTYFCFLILVPSSLRQLLKDRVRVHTLSKQPVQYEGLCKLHTKHFVRSTKQLHTKQFCMQLTKAFAAKTSCNQLLIDTAT